MGEKKRARVEIRWTLVWILLIGVGLITALAWIYTKEYVALIGAASSLLGGLGGAIKQMISPTVPLPDPVKEEGRLTPRGATRILMATLGVPVTLPHIEEHPKGPPQIRSNLLIVMAVGSVFIIVLTQILPAAAAVAIIALANGLLGYAVSSMLELVSPSPPPPDPDIDEGMVSPVGVERLVAAGKELLAATPPGQKQPPGGPGPTAGG